MKCFDTLDFYLTGIITCLEQGFKFLDLYIDWVEKFWKHYKKEAVR